MAEIVHFFWNDARTFLFADYLAVASAIRVHRPEAVMMWATSQESPSKWWRQVCKLLAVCVQDASVFAKTSSSAQNLSDCISYEALFRFGGLYMDTDTVSIKPLPRLKPTEHFAASGPVPIDGFRRISVGIMRAREGSPLLGRAASEAPKFTNKKFGDTGQRLLMRLMERDSSGICIWPHWMCYPYGWRQWAKYWENLPVPSDLCVLHYFATNGRSKAKLLDPSRYENTIYHRAVRQVFEDAWTDRHDWWAL